jgi:hypothetical protein
MRYFLGFAILVSAYVLVRGLWGSFFALGSDSQYLASGAVGLAVSIAVGIVVLRLERLEKALSQPAQQQSESTPPTSQG